MKGIRRNRIRYRLFFIAFIAVLATGASFYLNKMSGAIPEEIYVRHNDMTTVNFHVPMTGETSVCTVDLNKPVTFIADRLGEYKLKIKLFGLFDVKTVDVNVVDKNYVYPCGFQIGLYMKTRGVLAVNTSEITDFEGNILNPCNNIIHQGDYITKVNQEDIASKTDLIHKIDASKGEAMTMTLRRNGESIDVSVQPVRDQQGDYKIGLWVKDDTQGIGTLTFIDSDQEFGALGHGISDTETTSLLDIDYGSLYNTKILSIVKGTNGQPGEFIGTIDYNGSNLIGKIEKNTNCGIYGSLNKDLISQHQLTQMQIGYSYEVHKGPAYVRLYTGEEFKDYEIEITNINNNEYKNITYKVISPELIDLTNGIVQGMSGCPIIQDGKIVGAVTHVFVDDSRSGYGIFIEKMLNNLAK